jgi:hypothetical protein
MNVISVAKLSSRMPTLFNISKPTRQQRPFPARCPTRRHIQFAINRNMAMSERKPASAVTVAKSSVRFHISFSTIKFMLGRGLTSVSYVGSVLAYPHTSLNIINSILKRS